MSLIESLEDAINFSAQPISAYDPFFTKDVYLYRSTFDDFVHFIKHAVLSNPTARHINFLHGLYFDVIQKTKSYERHTGVQLLPTRFWKKSFIHSLYSGDTLTYEQGSTPV